MAKKISFFTIGIILLLSAVSEIISFNNSMDLLEHSMEQRAKTVALTTAHLTSEALSMNYLSFLQEEVVEIKKANPDVLYAAIVDSEKNILAHTNETKILSLYSKDLADSLTLKWTADFLEIIAPIMGAKNIQGNFIFSIDISLLKKARSRLLISSVLKCVIIILAGILLSFWVALRVVKPLNILSSYAQELPTHDFTVDEENKDLSTIGTLSEKYKDEVGHLAKSFMFMESELKRNIKHLVATTATKERIEGELNVAREIQLGLVPKTFPAFSEHQGFSLFATLQPAREIGGDLYDYFFIGDDLLCFALGDVSDKGVPAALFMAVTMTLIKNYFRTESSPAKIMSMINDALSVENPRTMFVTLILGALNLKTGEVRYANGGHNPSILLSATRGVSYKKELSGPVVGAIGSITFKELSLMLSPGDSLFLYTDGVNEAMNSEDIPFSDKRLLSEINNLYDKPVDEVIAVILKKIKQHVGSAPQSDDIAMMMMRYNGSC
jgi:phosphoserine phosphatase RsbU/P